jgi:cation:H+ antiporter
MAAALLQFALCAAAVAVAGTFLTRYADAIADITKLGRVLVGSIFLAGATSLPELLVDINAVQQGMPDLAVGDLMGSSLFNLLILAVADLLHRSREKMLSRAAAGHALSATMSIALTAMAAAAILLGKKLGGFTFLGAGPGTWLIVVAYVAGLRIVFFDQRAAAAARGGHGQEVLLPAGKMSLARAVVGYVVCALVIVVAAPFLAEAAGEIAKRSGLGDTFVGTTLVAFCTSLPELVATLAAVRMGAFDLAIGNIFGSNAFNMILLFPLDLFHTGPLLASASQSHAVTCLATIVITSVAVMGQLYQVERRRRFFEPDALTVVLLIVGALALLYYLK